MDIVTIASIVFGSNVLTNGLTLLFTKKKYRSEVDNNVIANLQKSLDFYKSVTDDQQKRIEYYIAKCEDLTVKVMTLQDEISDVYKFVGSDIRKKLVDAKNARAKNLEKIHNDNKQELSC